MTSLLLGIIYLAFISLGLPDSLLGSAWPSMYQELGASVSWARSDFYDYCRRDHRIQPGSDRMTRLLGQGR